MCTTTLDLGPAIHIGIVYTYNVGMCASPPSTVNSKMREYNRRKTLTYYLVSESLYECNMNGKRRRERERGGREIERVKLNNPASKLVDPWQTTKK